MHLTYILLTSHSGFFFFLFVALLACLLATYLTARRGRILWSPTRNPLVAIFIFDFPPSKWNPVSSGQIRNEADLPSRGCPVVWSWTEVTSLRLEWEGFLLAFQEKRFFFLIINNYLLWNVRLVPLILVIGQQTRRQTELFWPSLVSHPYTDIRGACSQKGEQVTSSILVTLKNKQVWSERIIDTAASLHVFCLFVFCCCVFLF